MRKDRRIWWRIVGGATMALAALANVALYLSLVRVTPGRLVQMAPHTLIVYEYEPLEPLQVPPQDELAKLFLDRLEAHAEPAGHRRIRVCVPFASITAYQARKAYLEALEDLRAAGVELRQFKAATSRYVPPPDLRFSGPRLVQKRAKAMEEQLASLRDRHADQGDLLDAAVEAYKAWADSRARPHDPDELNRILAVQAKLEFRIAPTSPGSARELTLTQGQHETYLKQLAEGGPEAGPRRGHQYLWFPFHVCADTERLSDDLVVGEYEGSKYLLLSNEPGRVMLAEPEGPAWAVTHAFPSPDRTNRPAIAFRLDEPGSKQMGLVTGGNKNSHMAILLDEQVCSAPIIRATIYDSGIIEGDFTSAQVNEMCRLLSGGTRRRLPVVARPVSVQTLGYTDPPRAALKRALLWAVAAAAALLAATWLWAALTGRLHAAGLLMLALPAAAIAWWQIVAWNNVPAGQVARASVFLNAIVAVIVLAVWIAAAATGRRGQIDLPPAPT